MYRYFLTPLILNGYDNKLVMRKVRQKNSQHNRLLLCADSVCFLSCCGMGDLACLTQQDVGYESHHNRMWKGKHTLSLIYLNESLVHWVCCVTVRRPVCMFMVLSNDLFPRHVKCWSGKSRQHGWLGQIKSRSLAEAEGEDRLCYGCFNAESRDCRLFLVVIHFLPLCVERDYRPTFKLSKSLSQTNCEKIREWEGRIRSFYKSGFSKDLWMTICVQFLHFLKKKEWCLPMLITARVLLCAMLYAKIWECLAYLIQYAILGPSDRCI